MPLPPHLAAKLAKRGLISAKHKGYQDPIRKTDHKGLSTCPNKSNVFHECSVWCETHWKGVFTPDARYVRNMHKLLAKYPLPNAWIEVFDKGLGRFYYWNMENDLVSWLPPKHPKAVLSHSAAKLREKRLLDENSSNSDKEDSLKRDRSDKETDRSYEKMRDDSDDDDRVYRKSSDRRDRTEKDRDDRRSKRERDDRYRRDREKRKREEPLDPMDPASYSDVPQGTWSDGLESNTTRADNTASGVLFQQRPYPSPGAVLAANKEKDDKERRK